MKGKVGTMLRTEEYNGHGREVKARITKGRKCILDGGLESFPEGVVMHKSGVGFIPDPVGRRKRGKITGWSAASRRRFRLLLLSAGLAVPASRFGVTLTCPWAVDDDKWDGVGDDWRASVNAFATAFTRAFPSCLFIYRVELQVRRAPHLHAIVYAPADGSWLPPSLPASCARARLYAELRRLWGRAMHRRAWTEGAVKGGFDFNGVIVDEIWDDGGAMRYVCDHASKRKQAQLGWKGRQWGVINKSVLVRREGRSVAVSEWGRHVWLRVLGRLLRYRVKAPCVFGSRLSHRLRALGPRFVAESTQKRIADYIDRLAADRFEQVRELDREREAEWKAVKAELMGQSVDLLE